MLSIEFWGVEVKAGQPLTVTPGDDFLLHLSQAALEESKKGKDAESVLLSVTVGGKKLVLGTLSSEKFPQLALDLVFETEFELSHNRKGGSVYFTGYKSLLDDEEDEYDDISSSDEEDNQMMGNINAEKPKLEALKPEAAKPITRPAEEPAKLQTESAEDDDSSDDDEDDSDDVSGEDVSGEDGSDDSDDSDSEEEDEDETPKKPESGKKRSANDSGIKTPVPNKKAKQATPQKTDGKKGGHTDTPHPVKKDGKPAAASKPTKTAKPRRFG